MGDRIGDDADLRAFLRTLDPHGRHSPPRLDPRPGRARRDRLDLLRYRDGRGDDRADIIDMLTMQPGERRRVVRLLGELSTER
jgi:hypothetical protein